MNKYPNLNKCPKCGNNLKQDNIVKLKGKDRIKIVGNYQYCNSMTCNFETD